jgi:hypothetical protein
MPDLIAVAARTRTRRIRVRLVAVGAACVRRRGEDGLIAVTRRARLHFRSGEPVRHVAARALGVTGGERTRLRMAGRAVRIGRTIRLVHAMAVEAAARTGVLGLLIGVAREARLRVETRRAMRVVTRAARLIAMCTDRMHRALRAIVTAHAVGRRDRMIVAEPMTVLAGRLVQPAMERSRHGGVARRAQPGGWTRETGVAVARGARQLADVREVTRALTDLLVALRHFVRWSVCTTATRDREPRDHDRQPRHGREPIG